MHRSFSRALLSALFVLAGCQGVIDGGSPGARSEDPTLSLGDPGRCDGAQPFARALRIKEVALYQTLKMSLFKDGGFVAGAFSSFPVIPGKPSLLRVFVEPEEGFVPRAISARLTLFTGGKPYIKEQVLAVQEASRDEKAASTFNFVLDGFRISRDTKFKLVLEESECGDHEFGQAEATSFPPPSPKRSNGLYSLPVESFRKLRVKIVPVIVNGVRPLLDARELAKMRDALWAFFPVPDVEVTVRDEPLVWKDDVFLIKRSDRAPEIVGMLDRIRQVRQADQPPDDVYYYGLAQPAPNEATYCQSGGGTLGVTCTLGISPVGQVLEPRTQYAAGVSFRTPETYRTLVHELAHADGRAHAPCPSGIEGPDDYYPRKDATTGIWGWDFRSGKLMSPENKDIMGYCDPAWIGNYNYGALAERHRIRPPIAGVAKSALTRAVRLRELLSFPSGAAAWTGVIHTEHVGVPEHAEVLAADGRRLTTIEVERVPLSHGGDVLFSLPEPQADWALLVLADRRIALDRVRPAQPADSTR